jgi:hypothetical protein
MPRGIDTPIASRLRIETRETQPKLGRPRWFWRSSARRTYQRAKEYAARLASAGNKVRVTSLSTGEILYFFRPGDAEEYLGAFCRVCGCTDDDCSECIERTGEPCSWVEPDLCSACVGEK